MPLLVALHVPRKGEVTNVLRAQAYCRHGVAPTLIAHVECKAAAAAELLAPLRESDMVARPGGPNVLTF